MELCKFPSIEQFRHAIKAVQRYYTYSGLDEKGKPIYDSKKQLPTLSFRGTVKLHGTNAAIGYCDKEDSVWAQSRTTILTESDQFGFYNWVQQKKDLLKSICQTISHEKDEKVYIFGEWCGGNVQKGVALQKLPKMFVIFAVLITKKSESTKKGIDDDNATEDDGYVEEDDDFDATNERKWLKEDEVKKIKSNQDQIYNIYDFETYSIDIDFNHPELAQATLTSITTQVEKCCPVSLALGSKGTGEGVVWKLDSNKKQDVKDSLKNMAFKVKGEEHAVSKGKEIVPIDTEKQASIAKFVDYAVTENRLKQGIQQVFTKEKPSLPKTALFVRWIENDVLKEEKDTLVDSKLEQKETMKQVSNAAKTWFSNYCKTASGNSTK